MKQWVEAVSTRAKPSIIEALANLEPLDQSNYTDADDIFRVSVFQLSVLEQRFEDAAPIAMDLAKTKHSVYMAQRASALYALLHDKENALQAASLWKTLEPQSEDAQINYLLVSAQTGQFQGLTTELKKRLQRKIHPFSFRLAEIAEFLRRLNQPQQALAIYQEVIKDETQDPAEISMYLSDFAYQAQNPSLAWDAALKALDDPKTAEAAIMRVLQLSQGKQKMQALTLAEKYIKEHPQARRVRLYLVQILTTDKNFEPALAQLTEMEKLNPEDFDLLFFRAQVLVQANRLNQAKNYLKQYLDVQSQRREAIADDRTMAQTSSTQAYMLWAQILEQQKQFSQAIDMLKKVDEPAAQNQVRFQKAVLYGKLKAYGRAHALLNQIQPEDAEDYLKALILNSALSQDEGKLQQALDYLQLASKHSPDDPALLYQRAMLYEKQGNLDKSVEVLNTLIVANPVDAEPYNALGYTLAQHDTRLDEAVLLLERSLALNPSNAYIQDSYGWLQFRLGNMSLAHAYLELAWKTEKQAEIAAHLADLHWRLGNKSKARNFLREGYKIDPKDPVLSQTIERLKVKIK